MARAGMNLGYEYVAVTDHSKRMRIAGGIDEETIAGQMREVDALNNLLASGERPFRVLRSLQRPARRSRSIVTPIGKTSTSFSFGSRATPASWCPSGRTRTTLRR